MPESRALHDQTKRQEREIKFVLELLASEGDALWQRLPAAAPRWIDIGRAEFATDKPLLALVSILVEHLNGVPAAFGDVVDVLDDIRDLLLYWMIESPFTYVFSRPSADQVRDRDGIWRVLRRLSLVALQGVAMSDISTEGMTSTQIIDAHSRVLSKQEEEELVRLGGPIV